MSLAIGLAIYLTIWWIVLFAVLPFGVKSQHEMGDVEPGTDPAAPVAPMLLLKAAITTGIATVIFAVVYLLQNYF
jgi:predicted secreted protein